MIKVEKYNSDMEGYRRCNPCYDNDSKNCILTKIVIGHGNGGVEMILCNKCLEELKKKISDRLVQSDLEEEYETVKM